jgi:hypothetical protein
VKSVIKQNDITGLNVTLKLDAMNKKRVFIQPSRYSPAAGFKYLMNGTWIDIDKDWECTFSIQDGKLYLDDNFVTDLSDALSIALPDNKAFVGFGGFSESFYDVGMTVTYDGTVVRNDYDNYGNVTTPETKPPVATDPATGSPVATDPATDSPVTTDPLATDQPVVPGDSQPGTNQNGDATDAYIEVDITGYVIAGVVLVLIIAGVIVLFVTKKKKA